MAVIGAAAAVIALPIPIGPARSGGASGFVVPQPVAGNGSGAPVARTVTVAAVSSALVLALQEQVGREAADGEARRHGHRLLDELARLQHALLSAGDAHGLADLSELARIEIGDASPALAGVLSSIRLRARIELERRSRSYAGSDAL